MQEIKIPDGHKATILGGTIRIEPIEKEFKKGDILYCEYFGNGGCRWICINKNINNIGNGRYFSNLIIKGNTDSTNVFKLKNASFQNVELDIIRLATDSEKQLLFNALAKEGKYWDAEALEVKDFIKVPESIGIYKPKLQFDAFGDGLFIGFNENKQVLGSYDGLYTVDIIDDYFNKVQCYLQPCKREDLKAGDTAFISKSDYFDNLDMYYKIIDISEYGFARAFGNDIKMVDIKTDLDIRYYKLIPINN